MSAVKQTSPQDAASWIEQGIAVLIDVREAAECAKERIAGAIHVPLTAFDAGSLPKDKALVIHCLGGKRGEQAANRLVELGFDDVHNLVGGLIGWKKAGLATVS
jgi:rhodanese-related sulfurtransferase